MIESLFIITAVLFTNTVVDTTDCIEYGIDFVMVEGLTHGYNPYTYKGYENSFYTATMVTDVDELASMNLLTTLSYPIQRIDECVPI